MIKSRLGVDIESMVVEGGSWNANLNQKIRNEISGNLFRFDMIANFAYYGSALAQEGTIMISPNCPICTPGRLGGIRITSGSR